MKLYIMDQFNREKYYGTGLPVPRVGESVYFEHCVFIVKKVIYNYEEQRVTVEIH